jgi:hypothetical protein
MSASDRRRRPGAKTKPSARKAPAKKNVKRKPARTKRAPSAKAVPRSTARRSARDKDGIHPVLRDLQMLEFMPPDLRRLVAQSFVPLTFPFGSLIVEEGEDARPRGVERLRRLSPHRTKRWSPI